MGLEEWEASWKARPCSSDLGIDISEMKRNLRFIVCSENGASEEMFRCVQWGIIVGIKDCVSVPILFCPSTLGSPSDLGEHVSTSEHKQVFSNGGFTSQSM